MANTQDQTALKEAFLAQRGVWSPQWDSLLKLDPTYFAAYLKLRAAASKGKHVSPKFQELIHLSVASVVSTMFVPGVEAHARAALDAGATKEEILEVLALTSVCGIHSISCGLPVLMEVLAEQGKLPEHPEKLDERRQYLKDDFEKKRGYWGATWDSVLSFDPDFFEAYTVSGFVRRRRPPQLAHNPQVMVLTKFYPAILS
jgi:alkylhydroperoxidase/carboxymuconolactone decarboxylase family protein YurZ